MKKKQQKTLELIFARPTSANVSWKEVISLMMALGAKIDETRAGSRVLIIWKESRAVFHKPHPRPYMDKAAVAALKRWLESEGVKP